MRVWQDMSSLPIVKLLSPEREKAMGCLPMAFISVLDAYFTLYDFVSRLRQTSRV